MKSVVPGPRTVPLAGWRGNAVAFLRDPIAAMRRLQGEYGDVAALARGSNEFIFFFDPEVSRQVFSDPSRFYNTDVDTNTTFRFPEGTAYTRIFSGGLTHCHRVSSQGQKMPPSISGSIHLFH
jgi:hypothetical protein